MGEKTYIYLQTDWPHFIWDVKSISNLLAEVRNKQGRLIGKMDALGFDLQNEAFLETLTADILKSNGIEGLLLNKDEVRSSVAQRLGIDLGSLTSINRSIDGIVDMMLDATRNFNKPLYKKRLLDWYYAMFPMGRSGMYEFVVGNWRDGSGGQCGLFLA